MRKNKKELAEKEKTKKVKAGDFNRKVLFPRELQEVVVITPTEAYRVVKGQALLLSSVSKGAAGGSGNYTN